MGRPKLFAGISAGSLDSMLAHYTAFRKKRHDDAYTPGGKCGARPNRAVVVYANLVKQAFKGLKIAIGGIEASLRRTAHYDFWTDAVRQSILLDSKADILLYGMGEYAIVEYAKRLQRGEDTNGIPQTVYIAKTDEEIPGIGELKMLPTLAEIKEDKKKLVEATLQVESQVLNSDCTLVQQYDKRKLVLLPPAKPLSGKELDKIYSLPFSREAHPSYTQKIPALDMIQFSITSHRGCGGGCSFCSLALHQGRRIQSRSQESVLNEAKSFLSHKNFKGSITDIGGPTANAYNSRCRNDIANCARTSCYAPQKCPNLIIDNLGYLKLLEDVSSLNGIKHVRVASGIRYDLCVDDMKFSEKVAEKFTGGQLKLAPEHSVNSVLKLMRKTDFKLFEKFLEIFSAANLKTGKQQFIVPYLMSAFPGCILSDMKNLAGWFKRMNWKPQQVQCFIPTPGTVATAMYYAECDTEGNRIYVAKTDKERLEQHGLIFPACG